jgi:hypothetical protein
LCEIKEEATPKKAVSFDQKLVLTEPKPKNQLLGNKKEESKEIPTIQLPLF